ncbi:MAG TPA: hypothetical protein VMX16_12805 [Terriglobia bacterium]|nr:hypothetical protein [Terriglobia bacterium]
MFLISHSNPRIPCFINAETGSLSELIEWTQALHTVKPLNCPVNCKLRNRKAVVRSVNQDYLWIGLEIFRGDLLVFG